jgi:hypothetical protein
MFGAGPFPVLGTRMFVGSLPMEDVTNAADDISDFLALEDVEVGFIEELGNFGLVFEDVGFHDIRDGRNFREKGGFDPGTFTMTVALDLTDPGQARLQAYAMSFLSDTYPVKLVFNGADPSVTAVYFGAKVVSFLAEIGTVGNTMKASIALAINTEIFYGVDQAAGLYNSGGVLCLIDDSDWPQTSGGAPGSLWSNGGVVSVVPGGSFALGASVFFRRISSDDLLVLGALVLPTSPPAPGTEQLWVVSGEVWVA